MQITFASKMLKLPKGSNCRIELFWLAPSSLTLPPYITNIDLIDMKGQSVGPETWGLTLDPGCKVMVIRPIMRSSQMLSSDDPDLLPRSLLKIMMEKLKASQAKL